MALAVLGIVFPIIGGIKANNGEVWKYPLSIPIPRSSRRSAVCRSAASQRGISRAPTDARHAVCLLRRRPLPSPGEKGDSIGSCQ